MTWTPPDPGTGPTPAPGAAPPPWPPPPLPPASSPSPPGPAEAWLQRPYPQLLRGPRHRWWRPLVGLAVLLGSIGALLLVTGVVVGIVLALATGGDEDALSDQDFESWSATPLGLLTTNLSLAALVPLAMLAVFVGHGWGPRWVASVRPGLRWRWTATSAAVTALVFVPVMVVLVLVDRPEGSPEPDAALLLLVVLLTTPLQAAGEEYLCRGWLTQAVGSLIARAAAGAVVAGLVSALVFAVLHGSQDPWLFADRFGFGLVASWLVWRTGGLEAGIAVHAVNNLVAFVPTILLGELREAVYVTTSDPLTTFVDVGSVVVVALVLDRLARRQGLQRTFVPPPQR